MTEPNPLNLEPPEYDYLKPTTKTFTFKTVNSEVLNLFYGGTMPEILHHSVRIKSKVKRSFWQWLTRKPVHYRVIDIPYARLTHTRKEA